MNLTPPLAWFLRCDLRRSFPRVRYVPPASRTYPLPLRGGRLLLCEEFLLSIAEGALQAAAKDTFWKPDGG